MHKTTNKMMKYINIIENNSNLWKAAKHSVKWLKWSKSSKIIKMHSIIPKNMQKNTLGITSEYMKICGKSGQNIPKTGIFLAICKNSVEAVKIYEIPSKNVPKHLNPSNLFSFDRI